MKKEDIIEAFNKMKGTNYNTLEKIYDDAYGFSDILDAWLKYNGIIGYTNRIRVVTDVLRSMERKMTILIRKVIVTDGMSNDRIIFVTDASDNDLKIWQKFCKMEKQNGESYDFLKILEQKHYVKRLFDSEVDPSIVAEAIGWDVQIDLND